MSNNKKRKAFTFIEILVACAITSVLMVIIYTISRTSYKALSSNQTYVSVSYISFGAANLLTGATSTQLATITTPKDIVTPLGLDTNILSNLTVMINSNARTITCTLKGESFTCDIP